MEIEKLYESIKEEIDKKIEEYKEAFNYDNKDFFAEIAFCILTCLLYTSPSPRD